ncbi:hypothetical protein [Listeria costaricensis]|uniref:hypothetical protein n=1 Tax=Listeria costaricensis TaxID=2026604 RepID=UPI000C08C639|nr:hypothetical protein [Listeria costaricensis]
MITYQSSIAKAIDHSLLDAQTILLFGSFVYPLDGQPTDIRGLWIATRDELILFSESTELLLEKRFSYRQIRAISQKANLLAMTKQVKLTLEDGAVFQLIVENGQAKEFVAEINARLSDV